MKPITESTFLKFMAKVSKAIDSEGGGEITPEDITPEMLDDINFRKRLNLYGHTVEEVEQLIDEGKCIWAQAVDDNSIFIDEDIKYIIEAYFLDTDNNNISKQDLENIEYILYTRTEIGAGILLHKISGDTFSDITSQFNVELNNDNYTITIGIDTF